MIFLDSNAVISFLARHGENADDWAARMFGDAAKDALACNLIVLAEVAAGIEKRGTLIADIARLEIEILELTTETAFRAAIAFREYRRRGGPRSTMLPDFLIGAHAATLGATLMTRDRRLASYFPELTFLTPENDNG